MASTKFSLGDNLFIDANGNVGINVGTTLQAKLHMSGSGNTSATYSMLVYDSASSLIFAVRNDSKVGIGALPTNTLTVAGTSAFTGSVLPGANVTYNLGSSAARWLTGYIYYLDATTVSSVVLSGSLTRISDGTSYLVAGNNVTIASQSNGSVLISATTAGSGADSNASFVLVGATGSLANSRTLTAGSGTLLTDAGAGSTIDISTVTSVTTVLTATTHFMSPSRDQMLVHSGSVTGTYYLPTSANTGDSVYITRTYGAGPLSIRTTGSWTINGISSIINLNVDGAAPGTGGNGYLQTLKFRSSGSNWNIESYIDIGAVSRAAAYIHSKQIAVTSDPSANNTLVYNGSTWGYGLPSLSTAAGWTDGGSKLVTTSSVAIDGTSAYAPTKGTDVYLWVSGTTGLTGASAKVSVFGGDVRVSGTLSVGTGTVQITSNDIQFGSSTRLWKSGSFILAQVTGGLAPNIIGPVQHRIIDVTGVTDEHIPTPADTRQGSLIYTGSPTVSPALNNRFYITFGGGNYPPEGSLFVIVNRTDKTLYVNDPAVGVVLPPSYSSVFCYDSNHGELTPLRTPIDALADPAATAEVPGGSIIYKSQFGYWTTLPTGSANQSLILSQSGGYLIPTWVSSSYTTTLSNWTVPAAWHTSSINITSSSMFSPGQVVHVQNAGYMQVVKAANPSWLIVRNLDNSRNVVSGTVISSGAAIVPSSEPDSMFVIDEYDQLVFPCNEWTGSLVSVGTVTGSTIIAQPLNDPGYRLLGIGETDAIGQGGSANAPASNYWAFYTNPMGATNPGNQHSYSAWVYLDHDDNVAPATQRIIIRNYYADGTWAIPYIGSGIVLLYNRLHAFLSNGGGHNPIDSGVRVPPRQWCHIGYSHNGTDVRFYINGVEVSKVAAAFNSSQGQGRLVIGGDYNASTPTGAASLRGRIQDARAMSTVRPSAWWADAYARGKAKMRPELRAVQNSAAEADASLASAITENASGLTIGRAFTQKKFPLLSDKKMFYVSGVKFYWPNTTNRSIVTNVRMGYSGLTMGSGTFTSVANQWATGSFANPRYISPRSTQAKMVASMYHGTYYPYAPFLEAPVATSPYPASSYIHWGKRLYDAGNTLPTIDVGEGEGFVVEPIIESIDHIVPPLTNDMLSWYVGDIACEDDYGQITATNGIQVHKWPTVGKSAGLTTQSLGSVPPEYPKFYEKPAGFNGYPALFFDSVDNHLDSIPLYTNPVTIYIVWRADPAGTDAFAYQGSNSTYLAARNLGGASPTIGYGYGGGEALDFPFERNKTYVTAIVQTATSGYFFVNGVKGATTAVNPSPIGNMFLAAASGGPYGATYPLNGYIAELIIYKVAHTDKEVELMSRNYLMRKYVPGNSL